VYAGSVPAFNAQLAAARQQRWVAQVALEQAHAALQLGLIEQADALVVEADVLAPGWGLVPDRWGLWPVEGEGAPALDPSSEATRRACLQLVDDYLFLRHLPALELWRSWLAPVQERWQRAADPRQLSLMGLLLGRLEQLGAPLEPVMEKLVGEEQVAADPSAALAVWAPLSRRLPQWTYARLKAADLSLQLQQLNSCGEHLEAATPEQRQLPWLCDIEARLAMARQQPREALRCWEEAIRLAGASGDEELAELFRQRRREAEWEAEWMVDTPVFSGASGDEALDRFAERLEAWAQRAGVGLSGSATSGEPDPEAFAAFLDQASGRLALAG
jgi:tetratricopeptide (TPR) repeat protein